MRFERVARSAISSMAASVGVEIGDPVESRVAWLLGGLRGVPVLAELLLIIFRRDDIYILLSLFPVISQG